MPDSHKPRWLRGIAVYQDVVLDGRTEFRGTRDCQGAWEAIAPHLPSAGAVLDVGSNFGWFGLRLCQALPQAVVASVEADPRSAAVQRRVLESNQLNRVCLLTHRANVALARRFAEADQRFDAVFCLSVLHWMADYREFLSALRPISGRLFVDHPDPDEAGAGIEHIRKEIGPIGPYLQSLFPDRPVDCLRRFPSHRDPRYTRELWMVGLPADWPPEPSPGLDVSALLRLSPGWPSGGWWRGGLQSCEQSLGPLESAQPRILFTPSGLCADVQRFGTDPLGRLRRLARWVPERQVLRFHERFYRRARRGLDNLLRRWGLLS